MEEVFYFSVFKDHKGNLILTGQRISKNPISAFLSGKDNKFFIGVAEVKINQIIDKNSFKESPE